MDTKPDPKPCQKCGKETNGEYGYIPEKDEFWCYKCTDALSKKTGIEYKKIYKKVTFIFGEQQEHPPIKDIVNGTIEMCAGIIETFVHRQKDGRANHVPPFRKEMAEALRARKT